MALLWKGAERVCDTVMEEVGKCLYVLDMEVVAEKNCCMV